MNQSLKRIIVQSVIYGLFLLVPAFFGQVFDCYFFMTGGASRHPTFCVYYDKPAPVVRAKMNSVLCIFQPSIKKARSPFD
jgi:hypothetical protein